MKKFIVTFLFVSLLSCSSEKIIPKFYTINFVNFSENPEDSLFYTPFNFKTLPIKINLKSIDVTHPYEQTKIAVRTKSHELKYYYHHFWAELPSTAFSNGIEQLVSDSKLFESIKTFAYDIDADYDISGIVKQVERVDIEDNYAAHLNMSLSLRSIGSTDDIVLHSFDRYIPIEEDSPMNIFAGNISLILHEEVRNFLIKVSYKLGNSNK